MSGTCPLGHSSASDDYCDVCGSPMGVAAAEPILGNSDPVPAPATCPHCDAAAAPGALFCENCGYDFTTGTAPRSAAAGPGVSAPGPTANAPEPPEPPAASDSMAAPEQASAAAPALAEAPQLVAPPVPGPDSWVAEIWVDPDWYAAQKPEDPMPSPGAPRVVPLRERTVLVGRPSASRGIRPQVDAGTDTGVSRRHCQLTGDGHRWLVEDLDSANGTYTSPAGDPLPRQPLTPGERHELTEGERVFIGGWTRIVVRKALPGETA